MPTPSHSAYDLLLLMIRDAASLSAAEQDELIGRLEAGEWNESLKDELLKLCTREAAALRERRTQLHTMRTLHERMLAESQEEATPHAERLLEQHAEDMQKIVDDFAIECASL